MVVEKADHRTDEKVNNVLLDIKAEEFQQYLDNLTEEILQLCQH